MCGYVWEVEMLQTWSISPQLVKPLMKLMEKAIGDIERGVPLGEQGWVEFDDETKDALLQTGLCEHDTKTGKIRILSSVKLPEDLTSLEQARIYLEINKAQKVVEELKEIWRSQRKYKAILSGLIRMLDSGMRAISPVRLEIGNVCSWDWFSLAHNSVNTLVLTAAEKIWSDDEDKMKIAQSFLGDRIHGAEDVEKALRWRDFVNKLEREAIEALGFLWYADIYLQRIEDPLARKIALKSVLDIIGADNLKKIEEVLVEMDINYVNFPW
jgi:hypothetical protein